MGKLSRIRIFPLATFDFETEEIARLEIANGLESGGSVTNLYFTSCAKMDLHGGKNLFLFQYKGKIIGKATVRWVDKTFSYHYYLEDITVFDEAITKADIQGIWKGFKKFNSVAQNIPEEYIDDINELCEQKKQLYVPVLGSNESFAVNKTEGNRIEFFTTRYERNPQYRDAAIKIHGTRCQICGFDFNRVYGYMGQDYIEVHHKKPLFSLEEEIIPNPETDMITVCSNCHSMIHRKKNNIITAKQLKKIIQEQNVYK